MVSRTPSPAHLSNLMTPDHLIPGNRSHEQIALVALLQAGTLPRAHLAGMVEQMGSAVRLLSCAYSSAIGAGEQPALFDLVPDEARKKAALEVASWTALPFQVSTVLDEEYPFQLRAIHNRPPLLFTEGDANALTSAPGVAVVGTRAATDKGKLRAAKLVRSFGEAGLTIFSGLAAGIDTVAHTEALRIGARTVAVFGTGLRKVFPKENAVLARDIVRAGGALVSQFLPDQHGAKWTFPVRNVTMSGLSLATVVVEAGATSGARMQARVALEHGRAVFLLQSLVDEHTWAQAMVETGVGNVRARVLRNPSDLVDGLSPDAELPELALA